MQVSSCVLLLLLALASSTSSVQAAGFLRQHQEKEITSKYSVTTGDSLKDEDDSYWSRLLEETEMSVAPSPRPPTDAPVTPPTEPPVAPTPTDAPPTPIPTVPLPTTSSPTPVPTISIGAETMLEVSKVGPGAAFIDQEIEFKITVSNVGSATATNVVVEDQLPANTTLVSSNPSGVVSGEVLTISIGDVAAGENTEVIVVLKAPSSEGVLTNQVNVKADNATEVSDSEDVQVGTVTAVTGAVASAGTALRNRASGVIAIEGIPSNAIITRAVLVWAILYTNPTPSNTITFNDSSVTADLTATISTDLCWFDSATIGYAADVTSLVSGNGDYEITDLENGSIRADSNPDGVLPFTDGASLFVFYGGPGLNDQVISDFTYSAENSSGVSDSNIRTLTGINSIGGNAILTLAGPDGQTNFGEEVRISVAGQGTLNFDNSWDGSAPISGPDFTIGNLWDHDLHNVSSILPTGQDTLDITLGIGDDCTGLSAVVLQVEQ